MTEVSGITPADIEAKFRNIQEQVEEVTEGPKKKATIGGIVAALVLLVLIYFVGRRSGKKKSTVLEIRRM